MITALERERLEDLERVEHRRLRPDQVHEKARLRRELEAETAEQTRVLDRQALRDSIAREDARNAEAERLLVELGDLDEQLADNAGDLRLVARRAGVSSRLAAIGAGRRKDGYGHVGLDDRLVKLASVESRHQLEHASSLLKAWCALGGILDDSPSDVDDAVKSFVREQIVSARQAVGIARQQCIDED